MDIEVELCKDCPAGSYTAEAGGQTKCLDCQEGTFSGEGASSCRNCPVGMESVNDKTDCGKMAFKSHIPQSFD